MTTAIQVKRVGQSQTGRIVAFVAADIGGEPDALAIVVWEGGGITTEMLRGLVVPQQGYRLAPLNEEAAL